MNEFLNKSKVKHFSYTPYWITLNGIIQCIIYILCEIYLKLFFPVKFERELFILSDGGTIALDWVVDHEGGIPKKHS